MNLYHFSLIKPEKYSGKRRGVSTSEISTIGSENQVKTYMDSSNGVRNASSNAYNKVRASATLLNTSDTTYKKIFTSINSSSFLACDFNAFLMFDELYVVLL